jgi:hypothetical protein
MAIVDVAMSGTDLIRQMWSMAAPPTTTTFPVVEESTGAATGPVIGSIGSLSSMVGVGFSNRAASRSKTWLSVRPRSVCSPGGAEVGGTPWAWWRSASAGLQSAVLERVDGSVRDVVRFVVVEVDAEFQNCVGDDAVGDGFKVLNLLDDDLDRSLSGLVSTADRLVLDDRQAQELLGRARGLEVLEGQSVVPSQGFEDRHQVGRLDRPLGEIVGHARAPQHSEVNMAIMR